MPFSSVLFLSVFLPIFLAAYWLSPRLVKNGTALVFSILFYAWGAPRLLPVVLGLGVFDFYLGRGIARLRARAGMAEAPDARAKLERAARAAIALGVTLHLSVLAYFKYSNFLVAETNALLAATGVGGPIAWEEVPLPIGISFLTFEEISYIVDVYRGDARPARSVGRYLLFLMLFPHSIAGPIFRWKDLEAQLDTREHTLDLAADGFARFVLGLGKKVLVADAAAAMADPIFGAARGTYSPGLAWLAALAYTIQIYFDFSGYSDMAIGLGKLAGFRFKENFDGPYRSGSIVEFWKRWHISLSTWLRDYLYVPLGGNRLGGARTRWNVLTVFALSGLWHGAAWTFVVWGIYHGVLSLLERTETARRARAALPRTLNVVSTFVLVLLGWVFFRAPNIGRAAELLRTMAFLDGRQFGLKQIVLGQVLPTRSVLAVFGGLLGVVVVPAFVSEARERLVYERLRPFAFAAAPLVLVLAVAQLVSSRFNPLIYFKF